MQTFYDILLHMFYMLLRIPGKGTFILLGKMLEERAKGNTTPAIKKLIGLHPKTVTVVRHGGHQMD